MNNLFKNKWILLIGIPLLLAAIFYYMRKANAAGLFRSLKPGGTPEANMKAFLWMIRSCEGTANEKGYNTLYGYKYFSDFSRHPNTKVTAGGYTSTAAGAYQILYRTWIEIQALYDLPDFSPESQDAAAVALIKRRKALDDVYAGRFDAAVKKCGKEWASLPGSPYGQPVKTLAQAQSYYLSAGGTIA